MSGSILIVDDDDDLRACISQLAQVRLRVPCIDACSLREVRHKTRQALDCSLAILDINLGSGEPDGLDVFLWLKDAGFKSRVVFLTGHAKDHPSVRRVQDSVGVPVYEKPLPIQALLKIMEGAA